MVLNVLSDLLPEFTSFMPSEALKCLVVSVAIKPIHLLTTLADLLQTTRQHHKRFDNKLNAIQRRIRYT